ncbi:MAG: DUF2997 domain-containing protein [Cyanobacteria bacterium SIG30]|nr:DUF2997 domain-containing protein [Cyanobacteria bacterium SIG30]
MAKKLQIRLMPDGSVKMETQGIKGKKCLDYLKVLEKLANVKIEKYELTPEYYEEEINYIDENIDNTNC